MNQENQYGRYYQEGHMPPYNMGGQQPAYSDSAQMMSFEQFQQIAHQQKALFHQQQLNNQSVQQREPNTNILDKSRVKEMCKEMCGNRDLLDDKVCTILAMMVDSMVENVVDQSCMYAKHRGSDTLEKEDVAFAVSQLFPEISRDYKAKDLQLLIDQSINLHHSASAVQVGADVFANQSIGVGGQVSTLNYKQKLLRVRKEQEQQMTMSNVKESLKQQAENIGQQMQKRE